jgi:transglutaminase-like putative cysteine protease
VRRRDVLAVLVLAVWVTALGVHVKREYFRPEAVLLARGALALGPASYFYTVEMKGQAIGMASSRLDTIPEGFRFQDLLQIDVPAMGSFHPAVVRTQARLGRSLELLDFEFQLESDMGDYQVHGQAVGDSILEMRVRAGAGEQRVSLRLGPTTTLPVALPLRMAAAGRLAAGQEYVARVLDPSTLADREVSVRVTGRDFLTVGDSVATGPDRRVRAVTHDTIPVWVVEESYGGVRVTSWVDQEGRLVRSESPAGFTIQRAPFEIADQAWKRSRSEPGLARGYGVVIENTAIAANADLSGVAHDVDVMAVRLLAVELDGFDLDGGRQTLRGDTLTIRREPVAALSAGYTLPYTGGGEPGEQLGATPLVQADDARIVETARRVAAGSSSPGEVARRLNDWVYRSLDKEITPSIPSAVQVLETLQGDCNEHTVLYVALARSLGLPAREAAGVVHLNGRFYYHAWPEVWLDRWVAVDPTLNQFPADPSHVRFLVGGLARQVELIRLIGRLELDIIRMGS